ncbi:MAG: hypothetical protein ACFFDY_04290 [Candidatus Thorarchaeota archaeon]
MVEKEKLIFCFYCGKLLGDYKDRELNRCPYCGVELNYLKNKISRN